MRRDTQGMLTFILGIFITMSAVGGMEHTPDYLLEQCLAAVMGLGLMLLGTLQIKDAD